MHRCLLWTSTLCRISRPFKGTVQHLHLINLSPFEPWSCEVHQKLSRWLNFITPACHLMSSHRLTDRPPRCGKPHIHLFPADCCCFSELQFCLTLNCPGDFIHNHSAPCSQDVTNLVLLMLMEPLWSLVLCIFLIPKTLDDNRSTGEDVLEAADDFVRTFQTKSRKIFRDYFLCSINIWTPEICSFYGVQKFFFQLLSSINNLSFFKHTLNHIKYIKSNTWHHSCFLWIYF